MPEVSTRSFVAILILPLAGFGFHGCSGADDVLTDSIQETDVMQDAVTQDSSQTADTGAMVLIPAGSFWMGCNVAVDNECAADESPYHEVTLSDYYMDKTEVTQAFYKKCVDAGECPVPECDWNPGATPDRPVVCVDWNQADKYCEWAGKRLPTEAEWEKSARGTDGRKYPWGNQVATCEYAVMDYEGLACGTGEAMDVCSRSPAGDSPYGLCDLSGNVLEWVSDMYGSVYYSSSPSADPQGPENSDFRVIRGGPFDMPASSLRASLRGWLTPNERGANVGFRCAR